MAKDRIISAEAQKLDERPVSSTLRPRRLSEYIGQRDLVERLSIALEAVRQRGDAMEHVLLDGPPGLGKTTLAHVIAEEMGTRLYCTSGPVLTKAGDLVGMLTKMQAHDVLFIDEIHRLPPAVEEYIYPAMEEFKIDFTLDAGMHAKVVTYHLKPFTLLGATTRAGLLTGALRSRFGISHHLGFYDHDDLLEILRRAAKRLDLTTISTEALAMIAHRSRGTPRVALRLLRRVRDFAQVRAGGQIDPEVIVDLPACVQTKEYATLTAEQAGLYQTIVDEMLGAVDRAEGIQRRGLVLATLTRLKQVCNHPAHLLQATGAGVVDWAHKSDDHRPLSARSGKCTRLIEMLEELLAAGDKALVFTQFRQMGHLLAAMIRHDLDCEAMFLHGGTPPLKRQPMIDRFQGGDGAAPIFILSLKAGGIGLNLTAANHVFHFDRWWNPAVENQATDRAYRIGQSRTVHVHKFVCVGTLEEHIDQMIEQKTHLADNVIGSGEQWVTELTTEQLHETLRLRATALEVDP